MIGLNEIEAKHKSHPLYVHPTTNTKLRSLNLQDFISDGDKTYRTIGKHLLVVDKSAPEYTDSLTARDVLVYSHLQNIVNRSPKVTEYQALLDRREAEWKAKPLFYRARWHLNILRLSAFENVARFVRNAFYFTTGWIGKGL